MGCSTSVYSQYPNLKRYRQLFELIELSDSSVRKLYDVFTKTDSDNSGKLNIVEFLTMLNMERTTFSNLVFNCMDKDGSGQIEFKEWIVSIWSFTSLGLYIYSYNLSYKWINLFSLILLRYITQTVTASYLLHSIFTIRIKTVYWNCMTFCSCLKMYMEQVMAPINLV